jgi:hypothetical protein
MVFVSVLPRHQSATGYEFGSAEFAIRPQNRAQIGDSFICAA